MAFPRMIAMVLAGGRVGELSVLTLKRPKSAMPFGGMYRVIDCVLTNIVDSGIENIGILSQYRPLSLMSHVGSGQPWDLVGYRRGVRFLPPRTGVSDADWYKGTADALYQNIDYMRNFHPDWVLIASGDHIYRMNFDHLIRLHESSNADVTMAVTPVEISQAHRFGIVKLQPDGRISDYIEKPEKPFSNLASMTIYLFKYEVLIRELEINAASGTTFQIYDEILPKLVHTGRVYGFVSNDYWSYSRSLKDYYQANMDCLGSQPFIKLPRWQLRTRIEGDKIGDPPPVLSGPGAQAVNSIVSPGCRIMGSVTNSVLSANVTIEEGASVDRSVLFEGVTVRGESRVEHAIIDKYVQIGTRCRIGSNIDTGTAANRKLGKLLSSGLTVIGKKAVIPEETCIGRNVLIYPDCCLDIVTQRTIDDGATVCNVSDEEA